MAESIAEQLTRQNRFAADRQAFIQGLMRQYDRSAVRRHRQAANVVNRPMGHGSYSGRINFQHRDLSAKRVRNEEPPVGQFHL